MPNNLRSKRPADCFAISVNIHRLQMPEQAS